MTMPLVLLFAVPFALVLHWVPTAFGAFFILGVLNIAFAQLLVIPNLVKNRIIWFLLPLVGSLKWDASATPAPIWQPTCTLKLWKRHTVLVRPSTR